MKWKDIKEDWKEVRNPKDGLFSLTAWGQGPIVILEYFLSWIAHGLIPKIRDLVMKFAYRMIGSKR